MHYLRFRYRIYVNEIKQLIAAISSISVILTVFFINVLVPVFLMAALMVVGIIASNTTEVSERLVYQWGYLLVTYLLVKIQAKAILATAYDYYVSSVPVSKSRRRVSDMLLLLNGGNLVLLAPIGFCLFIPDWANLVKSGYFVLFALSVLLLAIVALYRRRVPFGSLLVLPIFVIYFAQSAFWANLILLLLILSELIWLDGFKLNFRPVKIRHYAQLIVLYVLHRPVNFILRSLGAGAFIGGYGYLVGKRPDLALEALQLVVCLPVALVLGSYQFEIERYRSQYCYFHRSLPLMPAYLRWIELLPLALLSVISLVLSYAGGFAPWLLALQLLLILSASLGVALFNRHYYLLPSAITGLSYVIAPVSFV